MMQSLFLDMTWRNRGVLERQGHLMKSGMMADCTFHVGAKPKDDYVKAHKIFLCHSSSVFEELLADDDDVIRVEDVQLNAFRKMIEHMYTDSVDLENVETALAVFYAADKYQVNPLVSKCFQFIKQTMGAGDVCKVLEFARAVRHKELENFSIWMMQYHTVPLLKSPSFHAAKLATLITLLEQPALGLTSEVPLFISCVLWAQPRRTLHRSVRHWLSPLLSLFRFRSMSVHQFKAVVCGAQVLTHQEQRQIVRCLRSETEVMPSGMSDDRQGRENLGEEATLHFDQHQMSNLSVGLTFTLHVTAQPEPGKTISLRSVQIKSRSETDFEENVSISVRSADNSFAYHTIGEAVYNFDSPVYANQNPKYYFFHPVPLMSPVHQYQILVTFLCLSPHQSAITTIDEDLVLKTGGTFIAQGKTPIKSLDFLIK